MIVINYIGVVVDVEDIVVDNILVFVMVVVVELRVGPERVKPDKKLTIIFTPPDHKMGYRGVSRIFKRDENRRD